MKRGKKSRVGHPTRNSKVNQLFLVYLEKQAIAFKMNSRGHKC